MREGVRERLREGGREGGREGACGSERVTGHGTIKKIHGTKKSERGIGVKNRELQNMIRATK